VNVRAEDGTTANIVEILEPGTLVNILGQNEVGDWLNIELENGEIGWISASLIQVIQPRAVAQSTPTVKSTTLTVACDVDYENLGGAFRLQNSYVDTDYSTYSYNVWNRTQYRDYSASISVADEWQGLVTQMHIRPGYVGKMTIDSVEVEYLYEGDLGVDETLFFSFEFAEKKYSGSVTVFGHQASPELRDLLQEDLTMLIMLITQC
jgi:hypothetical protein